MFKIAIVIFREGLEISLLIALIMAITRKIENSRVYIIFGIMLGIICAAIFTFFAKKISIAFGGLGDEIFDTIIILITVFMISWTIVWMQGYEYKLKKIVGELSLKINEGSKSNWILIMLVATTIMREVTEIILLVYSISSTEETNIQSYILGLGIGAISGLICGVVIYLGLIKFANKYIFKISFILLAFIAAGLASEAAGILTSSGLINFFTETAWDSSSFINDKSSLGKFLKIIIGYSARPNILQFIFYFSTLSLIYIFSKLRKSYKLQTMDTSNV